jgi:hypothetical protein
VMVWRFNPTGANSNFRKETTEIYRWESSTKKWSFTERGTLYYTRRFPLGPMNKEAPYLWGLREEETWRSFQC